MDDTQFGLLERSNARQARQLAASARSVAQRGSLPLKTP